MRRVTATRYVTPLREGGSLPAIVEADDDGLYVLKFRGAGQGPKALVAELVCGELARALGLDVPEIVLVDLDPELARTEPDAEIQELIRASGGINLALDYLPGSITYDAVARQPDGARASEIVWFDAFVTNVDRTPRNTNLLWWHGRLWLIDHGAALYFHHDWPTGKTSGIERSASRFAPIRDHVLLPLADGLAGADARLAPQVTAELLRGIVAAIPADWLDAPAQREGYVQYLLARLQAPRVFVEEALNARAASL
jgi:hypothetical protein